MSSPRFRKAYVITDQPSCRFCADYAEELVVFDDPAKLMESLLLREEDVGVFIDVKYYIKLGPEARNRLLAVAKGVPHFRIRLDAASGDFIAIDDPDSPPTQERESREALRLRKEERVPVQLNVELAKEEDPFVQHAQRTSIMNISTSGAFIYCVDNSPFRGFAYVRIHELSNRRPVYCNIRWRRQWGLPDKLPGLGVQFVDLQSDQLRELNEMYIIPYLHFMYD